MHKVILQYILIDQSLNLTLNIYHFGVPVFILGILDLVGEAPTGN